MSKKIIWAHVLVKNEDRYLWFAIKSVIDVVDKLMIWDTGSTDETVAIIQALQKEYPRKIEFKEKGEQTAEGLSTLRQEMLAQTQSNWFMLLDGDEIWWKDSLDQVVKAIEQSDNSLYAIVSPVLQAVGDLYHVLPESYGEYRILGKKGHFNIRFINRQAPGLTVKGTYPLEGYYTANGQLLQDQDLHLKWVDAPHLHASHLSRSTLKQGDVMAIKRAGKKKFVLGKELQIDLPEVLKLKTPQGVQDPLQMRSAAFVVRAALETPARMIKRKLRKK